MERAAKEKLVKEFSEIFSTAITGVLVDYKGATVEELTNLRKSLHEKTGKFRVLKNSLAKIAVAGTPFESLGDQFTQTRALVYSTEDPAGPAKVITEEIEKNERMKLVGGVLVSGGKSELLDINEIKALGNLPGKEELQAKLLYLMNGPITNFARVLNEVPGSFVRVLQAISDSKK